MKKVIKILTLFDFLNIISIRVLFYYVLMMIKNTAEASLESVNEIDLVQSEIKKELLNLREGIVNNDEKFY
jgi:hypothetical protein